MSVSEWSDMLAELRASATKEEPQDFGPPEIVEVVAPFTCYGRKAESKEKIAAGVEASRAFWKIYLDPPAPDGLTEAITLTVSMPDGTKVGDMNVRGVIPYANELVMIEADVLSTA